MARLAKYAMVAGVGMALGAGAVEVWPALMAASTVARVGVGGALLTGCGMAWFLLVDAPRRAGL